MSKAKKMSREIEPEDLEDVEDMGDEEMDDIDEMDEDMMPNLPNKFWNVQLKPDEEHDLEPPAIPGFEVHITNACFGSNIKPGSRTVIVTKDDENKEVPICVLLEGKQESQSLNLIINEGLNFSLKGKNVSAVSLTGYIAPPSEMGDMDEGALSMDDGEDENLDDEDLPQQLKEAMRKRKLQQAREDEDQKENIEPPSKRAKIDSNKPNQMNKKENPNQQKSPQSQPQAPSQQAQKGKTQPQQQQQQPPASQPQPQTQASQSEKPLSKTQKKKQKKLAAAQAAANANNETTENPGAPSSTTTTVTVTTTTQNNNNNNNHEDNKEIYEDKKSPKNVPTQSPKDTPQVNNDTNDSNKKSNDDLISMKNGLKYKDIKIGNGEAVKPGQNLHVFYVGQLEDKSIFDKSITEPGFDFTLGKGEVVKGWDEGVKGMKVGGKRRLILPAHLAYGKTGTDGIPPNATLTFTIEIKKINK